MYRSDWSAKLPWNKASAKVGQNPLLADEHRQLTGKPILPPDDATFLKVARDASASEVLAGERRREPASTGIDDQFAPADPVGRVQKWDGCNNL